jgi:hypothetical protein
MLHQKWLAVLAAVAVSLAVVPAARAALIVDLQSGSTIITDNGPGDSDAALGRIINTSVVAGFGITITVGQSNSPGLTSGGILQIQSLDIQNLNPNPATLIIKLSDTGFTLPGSAGNTLRLESSVGGTFTQANVGDSVIFQSFADPANAQPAVAVPTPAMLFGKLNPSLFNESFSGSNSVSFVRNAGPYSLSNEIIVSLSANAQANISGTTTATPIPEPGMASLILVAGAMMLRLHRRRI